MRALDGVKVLDVSQVAAVPMAARFMADFGADVLHVEHPTRGDLMRGLQQLVRDSYPEWESDFDALWENYNRNKRGLGVDLSVKEGREIILKLTEDADVFLSNLRPFEVERYGLTYDELKAVNPRLIYGNLTGYGKLGAAKNSPAFDSTAHWGRAGVAYRLTQPWQAPMPGVGGFGDNVAGLALYGGLMTALYVRERTGMGQEVDVSLLHTGVYQLSFEMSTVLATGLDMLAKVRAEFADIEMPARIQELREQAPNPLILPYRSKDRKWILMSLVNPDRYWGKLSHAIGRDDLAEDPRFTTREGRLENAPALYAVLTEGFSARTAAELVEPLADIPAEFMQTIGETTVDAEAWANECFASFEHPECGEVKIITNPMRLSATPAEVNTAAPKLGEHTNEVLVEKGYSLEAIEELRRRQVVA